MPLELVWRKILTAPDASSLSVYQNHERTGYCEFATSVGQQMATVDADKPPPEGLVKQAGYQIHLSGNVALNDFTNRLKFAGRVQFASVSAWEEVTLKVSSRLTSVEIHALATNQTVQLKINSEGAVWEREVTLADLKNPGSLARALLGNGYVAGHGGFAGSDANGGCAKTGLAREPHPRQNRHGVRARLPD